MVGFISNLAPLLNYLRRRSPAPPFPPDSRQVGERGAINSALGAKTGRAERKIGSLDVLEVFSMENFIKYREETTSVFR